MSELYKKINNWILSSPSGEIYESANQHIQCLAERLFGEYEPTKGPSENFWQRFDSWLENLKDETEQQALFRLMASLFFIGTKELDNLYRVAFNRHATKWIIDELALTIDDPNLSTKVSEALVSTWFCPLTDSMRINAFYHLNHLSGRDHRPDWLSLASIANLSAVDTFIRNEHINRIVLLEDFIGSGDQVEPAIEFAGKLTSQLPTLVIPLVICPNGVTKAKQWETSFSNIKCRPVLELWRFNFLKAIPQPGEPIDYPEFRELVVRSFTTLLGGETAEKAKVYTPFGFEGTGGLVVLSTNCPDNTLPLIHHKSATWSPLFPRASRI
jgi:hypothetical protein